MFQVGLFSTFIPYLLFAFAYIGFLGTNALNKNQYIDCPDLLAGYEISFIDEYRTVSSFYSSEKDEINASSYLIEAKLKLKEINSHTKCSHFDKFDIENLFTNGYILARPPPINA